MELIILAQVLQIFFNQYLMNIFMIIQVLIFCLEVIVALPHLTYISSVKKTVHVML